MLHSDKYIQALINEQPFFEIHQENVLGVKMDVFKNRPKSLVDFIESSAAHGDKPYLIFKDQVITFNQHLTLVKKAAHILQTKYEVHQGDRVAIYAANSPEWIIFFWATVSLGAIACGLNGWWKGSEAIKAINDADPKVVVADQARFERIDETLEHPVMIFEQHDLSGYEQALDSFIRVDEDECACLLYTSGTTGTPKGFMTSHRSMIANSTLQKLQGAAVSQDSSSKGIDWSKNTPTTLLTSPLFHVSGLSAGAVTSLFAGSTTLLYDGRFLANKVIELIQKYNVTSWGGAVPTALKRVLDDAEAQGLKMMTVLVVGGAVSYTHLTLPTIYSV